ncbi:MAG: hypothetical protein MJ050_08875 [Phascolarctobacterium sp.]|nr:hypothetical protein [Phascolarctobacterium sp.]
MNIKVLAMISMFAFSVSSICEAGLGLFDKMGEGIGLGPSKKRVVKKIKPGTMTTLSNKHTYQIIDLGGGYYKAVLYAERMGGHIATVDSKEENDLLYDFMISQGFKGAYFGLVDKDFSGDWRLPDGSEPKYINWHSKQPDRSNANCKYAMFYSIYTNKKWKAGTFNKLDPVKGGNAFIIEWDKDLTAKAPAATPAQTTGSGQRPSGTIYYPVVEDEDVISND